MVYVVEIKADGYMPYIYFFELKDIETAMKRGREMFKNISTKNNLRISSIKEIEGTIGK